jgi:hypothetical protein
MATQGNWTGGWSGDWFGDIAGGGGNPVVFAALRVAGTGSATLGAEVTTGGTVVYAALTASGAGSATLGAEILGSVPTVAGGYDDEKKKAKKRFIVERDGKLMVFNTAQAALDAQPKKKKVQPVEVAPEQVIPQVIELPAVKEYAQVIGQIEQYNAAYNSQHFEQLIALFEQMRDEEDIEMLLLA